MIKQPTVIVCGAGIGGLTVAHELGRRGFEVTVYERNKILGGLARSSYYTNPDGSYPTEYSWRVYGAGYQNLLRILREIPLCENPKKSVFHNLVKVATYLFPRFDKPEVVVSKHTSAQPLTDAFAKNDLRKIIDKTIYCLTMCAERMDSLDNLTWKDFCNDLSPEAKKYMVQMWGPVLGMDATFMSFSVVARLVGLLLENFGGTTSGFYLMNKPTNDAWFDEWAAYLETQGVNIKTAHEIQDIKLKDGRIDALLVKDAAGVLREAHADYYVCGLSVETAANIVSKNPTLAAIPELKNLIPLAKAGKQIQLSVQLFLDQKLIYPTKEKTVLYLPDTPWSLIIEPEELAWEKTYCTDPRVKTVLSVGICQTDAPGIVHGKPFTKCALQEIQDEVWAQMKKSYECSSIKTESGDGLDAAHVVLFYMWDSFQFDEQKKEIAAWEPKFSNNAGTFAHQPAPATAIPNLFFATGYTKTDHFIYSMESATEAGVRTANAIIKQERQKSDAPLALAKIFPLKRTHWFLKPLVWLDALLFKLHLPHASKLTSGSNIMLTCLYFIAIILVIRALFLFI